MMYQIGDKFIVQDVLCEVRYINCGKAWVVSLEDVESRPGEMRHLSFIAFAVLDEIGYDKSGNKAVVVNNIQSGAV